MDGNIDTLQDCGYKTISNSNLKKDMVAPLRHSTSYPSIRKKKKTLYFKNSSQNVANNQSTIATQSNKKMYHNSWIVYRFQLASKEDGCCCACNSDAMFEIMKSLYDCYKKKNCDKCRCVLCGNLPVDQKNTIASGLSDVEKKEKRINALADMVGKSSNEKERILRELAMANIPLPEPRSPSESNLIKKVRNDLGLPPEPENAKERTQLKNLEDTGFGATPLEGKSHDEKYKILKKNYDLGGPLPVGRTPSEISLINTIIKSQPKILYRSEKMDQGKRNITERSTQLSERRNLGKTPKSISPRKTHAITIPTAKIRRAKAEGLLSPLTGKTPEQKEKILKRLANLGLPLPEGKTPSDKKIIDQVRANIGLPPEPKTPSLRDKYEKAANSGILIPLEGKLPVEKETILKNWLDRGIPLPEGRTLSEKALIANVKATHLPKIPSENLRKAKAAGLLTPLSGKTPKEKENIFKGLALLGLPLPEGKTPSDKHIISKVRHDIGLPQEPKTPFLKMKYNQAITDGVLVPLEGKTPTEKENIIRKLINTGLPLPEGRTPSEKALIAKIEKRPISSASKPSEKMDKAKAAGILTPLTGKTPERKENIVRGLAMAGLPLPEGKTTSEKKIIDKVRAELGLPQEPKTPALKEKYNQAIKDGILVPLEGKTPMEKVNILKNLINAGLPLPEGRTHSEKSLIAKIKKEGHLDKTSSEILRKAKAAGLLTPLTGKTPEKKEEIVKGLALAGLPLPSPQTPSENKIIDKVCKDLGLPLEPKTPAVRDKYNKAFRDGIIVPLQGKTPQEKEKILKELVARGLPLPEGRTTSEKNMIAKIKPAEILPSLSGKSPEEKKNILRKLAMERQPFPEPKTPSEKYLMDKIRGELGSPLNKRFRSPSLISPEERKKLDEKTNKLMKEEKGPSEECICGVLAPESKLNKTMSEKIRDVRAAGLLTPLEGKTPEQKEKILTGLVKRGLPLPESKTNSDRQLVNRVRSRFGLPPEPRTASMKEKYANAAALGLLTPLYDKTPAQKEMILRALADKGIPLPDGRTPSEKAMIAAIKGGLAKPSNITEKKRKAKLAGLLTPLEGKTPAQKENILRGLADIGIPLPEGKTISEKMLIRKINLSSKKLKVDTATNISRKSKPSPPPSEKLREAAASLKPPGTRAKLSAEVPKGTVLDKSVIIREKAKAAGVLKDKMSELKIPPQKIQEANAAGLITPLSGKSPDQKYKIIKGLAQAGLPLPEGKTSSEKDLIKMVKKELGLLSEPQSSSMKVKLRKAYEDLLVAGKRSKATVSLQTEIKPKQKKSTARKSKISTNLDSIDIVKTTKCDQACGCDKKKIKFKHSYVKIRVTSPDISSICPCPETCFPRVKSGTSNDNEGIKITIGSAILDPSFSEPLYRYLDTTFDTLRLKKRFSDSDISYPSSKANPSLKYPKEKLHYAQSDLSTYYSKVQRNNDYNVECIMRCRRRYKSAESVRSPQCDNSSIYITGDWSLNRMDRSEETLNTLTDSSIETPLSVTIGNTYYSTSSITNSTGAMLVVKTASLLTFSQTATAGTLKIASVSSSSRCYILC